MINAAISEILREMAFFAELAKENPFKIRAWQKAADILADQETSCEELLKSGELTKLAGVGKGTQAIVKEFVETGKVQDLETLRQAYPPKLTELLQIRGLGPKKIQQLYEELQIGSIADLEYACLENRLVDLKGFGAKTQESVMKQMELLKSRRGKVIFPVAEQEAEQWREIFLSWPLVDRVEETGEFRRRMPVVDGLDFLLQGKGVEAELTKQNFHRKEEGYWEFSGPDTLPVRVWLAEKKNFGSEWLRTTGPKIFVENFGQISPAESEEEIFAKKKTKVVTAEARDLGISGELLEVKDIRGVFHLHTTWSDGKNTLAEMVQKAEEMGLEYLGVSDHSKSAFYANGLEAKEILQQREEIAKLQKKYPKIKIFHGIESDILSDGSLDYDEEVLAKFDFVIASVHGQMKMSREQMTKRLCKALENPYTTWLGHWTGRLLLGREGYEFDTQEVLATAAKFGKGIELNANPYRLDVDWQILPEAVQRKVTIGVFPDAHSTRGLEDIKYGVMMARKAGLRKEHVTNSKSREEMEAWLQKL
jgi:DNA polymerase (family 10)